MQIFVTVPGADTAEQLAVLQKRMQERADAYTDIDQRLQRAEALELPYQSRCDYVVVNDLPVSRHRPYQRYHSARVGCAPPGGSAANERYCPLSPQFGRAPGAGRHPLDYGDLSAEYEALDQAAILLDRSHEGRILLSGEDRLSLVNRMSTNDLSALAVNDGRATIFTDALARILFRAECYHRPEGLLLISEPGQGRSLANFLRRNIFFGDKVAVTDNERGDRAIRHSRRASR